MTGATYFFTIVDEFTCATWTYLMAYKSQAIPIHEKFLHLIQNQFHTTAKTIKTDNDLEFLSKSCQTLLDNIGILHQQTCPYTPQQNEVAERKHRHLLQITRAILFQSGMPKSFWGEALLHATYLINRLLTKLLSWKTPYEMLFGKPINIVILLLHLCQ